MKALARSGWTRLVFDACVIGVILLSLVWLIANDASAADQAANQVQTSPAQPTSASVAP